MNLRIGVVIATRWRSALLTRLLQSLASHSRPPDLICVSAIDELDLGPARDATRLPSRLGFGDPRSDGATKQGRSGVAGDANILVFFDDDFLPSRHWLQRLEGIALKHPRLLGIDGKGTMRPAQAAQAVTKPLFKNVVRAAFPEPYIDRRGRLWGNLLGLASLLSGRDHATARGDKT